MRKLVLLLFILPLTFLGASAQAPVSGPNFDPAPPPSPTVAGMLKFVDMPVSQATGTPGISIPIYEINTGQLKLPITLSYHPVGIKVEESAGNVGLGWSLSAEGVISQTTMGRTDDGSYQNPATGGINWPLAALNPTIQADYDLLWALSHNATDGVPDLFNYSFGGESGKFIVADKIRLLPQKNIQVNRPANDQWEIITENGTHYFFDQKERVVQKGSTTASQSSFSWYLSKIANANRTDSILFTYQDTKYEYGGGRSYSMTFWFDSWGILSGSGNGDLASFNGFLIGKQLQRIDFKNGSIVYDISWNDRTDFYTTDPANNNPYQVPKINQIFVQDNNEHIVKVVHFIYGYYNDQSANMLDRRLRLDKVVVNATPGTIGTPEDQVYTMSYEATPLPRRSSLGQDHWGFYNGANSNTTLIPSWGILPPGNAFIYNGANREPNASYMKAGILNKLTYPTGGYVQFDYEANSIPPSTPFTTLYKDTILHLAFTNNGSNGSTANSTTLDIPSGGLFTNGVAATFSAQMAYPPGQSVLQIDHSQSGASLRIDGSGTTVSAFNFNSSLTQGTNTVTLQPGTSYFMVVGTAATNYTITADLLVKWPYQVPSTDQIVGGLRIKNITFHDIYTNQDNVTSYSYKDPATGFSSGKLYQTPTYSYPVYRFDPPQPGGGTPPPCAAQKVNGIYYGSNSVYNLGTGNHIGYSFVTETKGAAGQGGSSLSEFTNFDYYYNPGGEIDQSWLRGLLLSKKDYDNNSTLVHQTNNFYTVDAPYSQFNSKAVILTGQHICATSAMAVQNGFEIDYLQKFYVFPSQWVYLDSTSDQMFYGASKVVNTKKNYYDNKGHMELTRQYSNLSDGTRLLSQITYPTDYVITSGGIDLDAIAKMQLRHMHNLPIEVLTKKADATGAFNTISGKYYEYKDQTTTGSGVLPYRMLQLATTAPINYFQDAYVNTSAGAMHIDNHYQQEAIINSYDFSGNITDVSTRKANVCYLYGYGQQYPVAKGVNVSLDQIAYTSFETNEMNNWNYYPGAVITSDHITGNNAYNLSLGSVSRPFTADPANPYIVSLWSKNGQVLVNAQSPSLTGNTVNGWTYYEYLLQNPNGTQVEISGSGLVDEVRFYPQSAQMETYTYNPLVGVSSVCDVANRISYYEYDKMGRLVVIRDQDGNITKKVDYTIQGQD